MIRFPPRRGMDTNGIATSPNDKTPVPGKGMYYLIDEGPRGIYRMYVLQLVDG